MTNASGKAGPFTIWFTGISGSGKSTLANKVCENLTSRGLRVEILDGDLVRPVLSQELGFNKEERCIHLRRVAYVCNLLTKNGVIAISATISPYEDIRNELRGMTNAYVEVFIKCSIERAKKRDVKGLY